MPHVTYSAGLSQMLRAYVGGTSLVRADVSLDT